MKMFFAYEIFLSQKKKKHSNYKSHIQFFWYLREIEKVKFLSCFA